MHYRFSISLDERDLHNIGQWYPRFSLFSQPFARGELPSRLTLAAPALSPPTVMLFGSPSKKATFSFTHFNAKIISSNPRFPGNSGCSALRKPEKFPCKLCFLAAKRRTERSESVVEQYDNHSFGDQILHCSAERIHVRSVHLIRSACIDDSYILEFARKNNYVP